MMAYGDKGSAERDSAHGTPATIAEAAAAIQRRDLSPVTVVQAAIEAVKSHNSEINAVTDLYAEAALAQARLLEAEAHRGAFRGPLHGIPILVKDLFYTKGLRTTRGSRIFVDFVPQENAPIVERVLAAGAILLGKTATTEFGWSAASTSRLFGPTRNPWDPSKTSGGSSSGSAAAVAARMVPAALGSDGGGSVRIPGAFCGVFALKGSLGRIPVYPWSATEMLSHAGPITLTVADSALLFEILKGPDPRDHQALPTDPIDYAAAIAAAPAGLRVGFAPTLFDVAVDPQVAAAVRAAAERLAADDGVVVEECRPDWSDPFEVFETLWVAGRGIAYGRLVADRRGDLDPGFATLVEAAGRYGLADYLAAMEARARFAGTVHRFFERYDILITPTVPVLPFAAERQGPAGFDDPATPVAWARWTPFTYPFNLSGNPAASLPCGWSAEGLPIGMQVIGRRFADADVLRLCAAIERARPWRGRVPGMLQGH
jgi:aspartyl-tRNA(Asn)/glutamyl-tRNA(Gln) amidotransferase subunit A